MGSYGYYPKSFYYKHGAGQLSGAAARDWDYSLALSSASIAFADSRLGQSMPGWRRRIAQGRNATTPFSGVRQNSQGTPCDARVYGATINPPTLASYRKRRTVWNFTQVPIPNLPPLADYQNADAIARQRFYKSLESTATLFQGGVFLGELKETLQLLASPAKTLRRRLDGYLNDVKKRRRGTPKSKTSMLADKWLEHSFGWQPLLNDIDSANKYLDRRSEQLLQTLVRCKGYGKVETTAFAPEFTGNGVLAIRCLKRFTNQSTQYYAGALSSTASSQKVMNIDSLGLSPRSFVPTLWEILPWSFAIDYFSNIGDVISAWSNQTIDLAWGSSTARRISKVDITSVTSSPQNLAVVFEQSLFGGNWQALHKSVGRSPISSVPLPSIKFEIPGFGRKWLNLAALGASRRLLTPF